MSATIHRLFGDGEGPRADREAPAHPLVEKISRRYVELLGQRVERMFDGADDLLFEMGERASSNAEQRLYLDTMRAVRLERPRLTERFIRELSACFHPSYQPAAAAPPNGEIDFDRLSLQDNATLEQNIAVANMESKAAGLFRHPLWEIERRLAWLSQVQGAAVSPAALAPAGLCQAFRRALEALNVDLDIKLVIFKLFDRLVISGLGPVYDEVLLLMEQNGIEAPPLHAQKPEAADASPATPYTGHRARRTPGGLPQIDAHTLNALRYLAGAPPVSARGSYYSDAMLAADLARIAGGQVPPGLESTQAWALLQRAELVGQMFNAILADPSIPESLKPLFEELRFPVIKTALDDISFFSDARHPVRSFINELSALAAAARSGGGSPQARLEKLVRHVREKFDPAADRLRPGTLRAQPLPEADIDRFLEDQLGQGRERRKAILEKARKVVAQELEIALLGRNPPATLMPLLQSGWAPMMGATLLRRGLESPEWTAGMELLLRILASVDARLPLAARRAAREGLRDRIRQRLVEVGTAPDKLERFFMGLETAWLTADAGVPDTAPGASADDPLEDESRAAGPPPRLPPPEHLLEMLLTHGAWFRLFDARDGETRWLKVVGYAAQAARVSFAEFDGKKPLTLGTQALFEDLLARRSEPIDPTPAARAALDQYIHQHRGSAENGAD